MALFSASRLLTASIAASVAWDLMDRSSSISVAPFCGVSAVGVTGAWNQQDSTCFIAKLTYVSLVLIPFAMQTLAGTITQTRLKYNFGFWC